MKYTLILIFVCIAVSFAGCDARPTAPEVPSTKQAWVVEEVFLIDGTRCAVLVTKNNFSHDNGGITCDWKDKARKR